MKTFNNSRSWVFVVFFSVFTMFLFLDVARADYWGYNFYYDSYYGDCCYNYYSSYYPVYIDYYYPTYNTTYYGGHYVGGYYNYSNNNSNFDFNQYMNIGNTYGYDPIINSRNHGYGGY